MHYGVRHYLGTFDTAEQALQARNKRSAELAEIDAQLPSSRKRSRSRKKGGGEEAPAVVGAPPPTADGASTATTMAPPVQAPVEGTPVDLLLHSGFAGEYGRTEGAATGMTAASVSAIIAAQHSRSAQADQLFSTIPLPMGERFVGGEGGAAPPGEAAGESCCPPAVPPPAMPTPETTDHHSHAPGGSMHSPDYQTLSAMLGMLPSSAPPALPGSDLSNRMQAMEHEHLPQMPGAGADDAQAFLDVSRSPRPGLGGSTLSAVQVELQSAVQGMGAGSGLHHAPPFQATFASAVNAQDRLGMDVVGGGGMTEEEVQATHCGSQPLPETVGTPREQQLQQQQLAEMLMEPAPRQQAPGNDGMPPFPQHEMLAVARMMSGQSDGQGAGAQGGPAGLLCGMHTPHGDGVHGKVNSSAIPMPAQR
jgi:hypothetical protein